MRIDQVTHNCIALIKEKLEEHISKSSFNLEISKKLDFIQHWLDESKLTIAIPEKITKEWYRDVYLISDHWQKKRAEALAHANWACQLCNQKELLNVHHRTYENLGCENIQDLIVLCGLCHDKFHGELEELADE